MNFIFPVIGLILLPNISESQWISRPVIVKWPDMNEFFNSAYKSKYPFSNNLFETDEELCDTVQKSNIFIIEYEQFFPYENYLPMNTWVYLTTFDQSQLEAENNEYTESMPIEDVFNIIDYEEFNFDKADRKIDLDFNVNTSVCYLSNKKSIYISAGVKKDGITVHFLFARTNETFQITLIAAIGRGEVKKIFPPKMIFEVYGWTIFNDSNNLNWEKRKINSISRVQRIWIGAIIKNHIVEKWSRPRGNFKIKLLYMTKKLTSMILMGQYQNIFPPTQYFRYTVLNNDSGAIEETMILIPNCYSSELEFYYAEGADCSLDKTNYLSITFH